MQVLGVAQSAQDHRLYAGPHAHMHNFDAYRGQIYHKNFLLELNYIQERFITVRIHNTSHPSINVQENNLDDLAVGK